MYHCIILLMTIPLYQRKNLAYISLPTYYVDLILKNLIRLLDSIYFSLCLTIRHLFVSQSAGFCVVKKHYALLTNVHENVYAVPEAICLLLIDDLYDGEE